ncbi:MAG: 30S ribosome-binding factor RbfA [Thermodesulfobacterium geofontis]|uniref:Ribosome-binding factor A n=1 Tax=Thermodesulfobacterium geofontis TaxID=1295609 RepID=A0A2N7PM82_9BACT|nr:MAG: 30S ribosome-binding factor RbfA [Thermodesulfobacterium geofontis]PMP97804.1 MAG: 30S ribosome-binding factor RbfA [Thermodesulfobacterium geofontis]
MSYRSKKVASLLQEVISEIIMHELNDPIFKQFITITEVKIGEDLKKAIIYFTVYEGNKEEVEKALNKAKGYIKKLLGEKITIKYLPDIEFRPDDRMEKEKRIDELLAKISKES